MTKPTPKTRLQDLNIFELLRLGHLSDEKKFGHIKKMQQIVFSDFINTDLPGLLDDKAIFELEKISKKKDSAQEIEDFLREKIKDYDLLIAKKFLVFKSELVRHNMRLRLKFNQKGQKKLAGSKAGEEKAAVEVSLKSEEKDLKAILDAIEKNDWDKAKNLIETLPSA